MTFSISANDILAVGALAFLEVLLSADNALVLALIARELPGKKQQNKALTAGMVLSYLLRLGCLVAAVYIIKFWYLKAIGAAYLIYLAASRIYTIMHHKKRSHTSGHVEEMHRKRPRAATFSAIIVSIALTDLVFAIDSILVAVGVVQNIWIIYAGVALGMLGLRILSTACLKFLEKYPAFDITAYILVGWVGVRLMTHAIDSFADTLNKDWPFVINDIPFWIGMFIIITCGYFYARREKKHTPLPL